MRLRDKLNGYEYEAVLNTEHSLTVVVNLETGNVVDGASLLVAEVVEASEQEKELLRALEVGEGSESIKKFVEEKRAKKQAGTVNGKHYTEYVEQAKQLKREGKHQETIELLLKLIDAVEREAKVHKSYGGDGFCAPGYYKQLAIIYRKEKRYYDEVAIIEQLTKQNNYLHPDLSKRLQKARELRDKRKSS